MLIYHRAAVFCLHFW